MRTWSFTNKWLSLFLGESKSLKMSPPSMLGRLNGPTRVSGFSFSDPHRDMDFALLPTNVGGLLNDPYRTLSRWVRESCGYVKAGKEQCDAIRTDHEHKAPFFMEFFWGDFFRQNLPLKTSGLEVCKSIPYTGICLDDEVPQLKAIYEQAMTLAVTEKAKTYFEEKGLDPWDYGFNPGEHLQLEFSGYQDACEEPVTQ